MHTQPLSAVLFVEQSLHTQTFHYSGTFQKEVMDSLGFNSLPLVRCTSAVLFQTCFLR